jgi:TonB family protein
MTLSNLLAWCLQVLLVAAAGALVPLLFRLKASRARLWYWHAMLLACLLLPLVEPWAQPAPIRADITFTTGAFRAVTNQASATLTISWTTALIAILAAGVLARVLWLAGGLLRLRSLYRTAVPLDCNDDACTALQRSISPEAEILVSGEMTSPVTFGIWNPVVLLPAAFLELSLDERRSIICHELMHVARRDWAVMIGEEIVRSLLWFHPAIWWLLAQIQLTREQVVDEAVIEHTGDRNRYLEALLAIASLHLRADLAPAPLFLKKRHLRQRVESILSGARMTKRNLLFSLAAALASLPVVIGVAAWQFPLTAAPQEATDDSGIEIQLNGARVLHRTGIAFPSGARARHLSGAVVAAVTVDDKGEVIGAQALSGPDELRKPVVRSLANWHFALDSPNAPRTFEITVKFDGVPAQIDEPVVVPANSADAPRTVESINLATLPAALRTKVTDAALLHVGDVLTRDKLNALEASLREIDDHLRVTGALHGDSKMAVMIRLASPPAPAIQTRKPTVIAVDPRTGAVLANPSKDAPKSIRVGGNVQAANLIDKVKPIYPPEAKQAHIEGTVKLEVLIGADGFVKNIQAISGHPLLVPSSIEAVKNWVYKPTLLNGNPVEVITIVDINFTLAP